jgi:hypothetical protein
MARKRELPHRPAATAGQLVFVVSVGVAAAILAALLAIVAATSVYSRQRGTQLPTRPVDAGVVEVELEGR